MKLPPMALTAPRLCPRCDSPAMFEDHCVHCALQLRQCGACQGIAGPFDRYCGFCGHEIVLGRKRHPAWRLWLVAALIPLIAGLLFGISPLSVPAATAVARVVRGNPTPSPQIKLSGSQQLGFTYARPPDWFGTDYSMDPTRNLALVVVYRLTADNSKAADAQGDLLLVRPQGALAAMGRPQTSTPGIDPRDPAAVLAVQVSQLLAQPPSGTKVDVVRAAHSITVDHKPGAEVTLRVTAQNGVVYYYERAYVAAPKGSAPLFRVDASAPTADWEGGDGARVEALIQSLKFG